MNIIKTSMDNSILLTDVSHSAGFKTYWISNQTPYLDTSKSVFDLHYNKNRKRILEDNTDYDLK